MKTQQQRGRRPQSQNRQSYHSVEGIECHLIYFFPFIGWNIDTVRALESLGLIGIVMVILFSALGVAQDNGQSWKMVSILTSFASCK